MADINNCPKNHVTLFYELNSPENEPIEEFINKIYEVIDRNHLIDVSIILEECGNCEEGNSYLELRGFRPMTGEEIEKEQERESELKKIREDREKERELKTLQKLAEKHDFILLRNEYI